MYEALSAVRRLLDELEFPFEFASAAAARRERDELLALLDLYILPRLEHPDAPLLMTVGGPTGSGASTIVNTLVGEIVTMPGVLRPTTRIPVLVHHPNDTAWFTTSDRPGWYGGEPALVERIASERVPAGVALLDAPPLDSVAASIRRPALEAIVAADLWLFITTAARYADALQWDLLGAAAQRRMSVAVVLNRVPAVAMNEVRSHLAELLAGRGLPNATLLDVIETELTSAGVLPSEAAEQVMRWFTDLAGDEQARTVIIRRTLHGAVEAVLGRLDAVLAGAGEDVFDQPTRDSLLSAASDVRRAWEDAA